MDESGEDETTDDDDGEVAADSGRGARTTRKTTSMGWVAVAGEVAATGGVKDGGAVAVDVEVEDVLEQVFEMCVDERDVLQRDRVATVSLFP